MQYPSHTEYIRAMISACDNLDKLAHLVPIIDNYGEPFYNVGTFAIVFKMRDTKTNKCYALKCFTTEQQGRAEAYKLISEEFETIISPYLTSIQYFENELLVNCNYKKNRMPVLLMDWVEGITMDVYIKTYLHDTNALNMLCYRFSQMANWLRNQSFAHGDIKPDNILVREDGTLTLVDYDGMFVPAMRGQKSPTLGTRDFVHPERNENDFDENIDDFTLASIALSLKAIAIKPSLFNKDSKSEGLLFTEQDYKDLPNSKALEQIKELLWDKEMRKLYGLFILAHAEKDLHLTSSSLFNLNKIKKNIIQTPTSQNQTSTPPLQSSQHSTPQHQSRTFTVNGISFEMIPVEGGTFTMGATPEQGDDVWNREKPIHQVTLSNYAIGKTEVTQALWKAVMGNNPSCFKGDNLPVEFVSWHDCQEFIRKLNKITKQNFRLPTEAEWEFAARGGNRSKGYKYAGSNNIDEVAWYDNNANNQLHPIATKQPNELGIYDMSGNVWEWCQDWYGSYTSDSQTNPKGPNIGSCRIFRGGSYCINAGYCRVSDRDHNYPYLRDCALGFRLCLSEEENNNLETKKEEIVPQHQPQKNQSPIPQIQTHTFTINDITFEMIPVEGGTFTMGAIAEQGEYALDNEKPSHQVTLDSYSIGKTEVTQALWMAVMGSNPSYFKGDNLPVEKVSWEDCQEFIKKLNQFTGQNFRLPTEAEWEFAARGGNKSKGHKYAGSNNIDNVAWYNDNSNGQTHPVATRLPNELGIYDMNGNVWEWCQDKYKNYTPSSLANPQEPSTSLLLILKGGSWHSIKKGCRISTRFGSTPNSCSNYLGFRLCLS